MSLHNINFDWHFYYCMIFLVTLWNCGFMAITREGKIAHFVLKFFERKRRVETYFGEAANKKYDTELMEYLSKGGRNPFATASEKDLDFNTRIVSDFLESHKIYSDDPPFGLLLKLASLTRDGYNRYYYLKEVPLFPYWVRDPVVCCITCMASFHSLVLYTVVVLAKDLWWNPLEWVAVAIPVAFTGEFFWFLKKKIQSSIK